MGFFKSMGVEEVWPLSIRREFLLVYILKGGNDEKERTS
jgi:hypothetical protein